MQSRRNFLQLLTKGGLSVAFIPPFLQSCGNNNNQVIVGTLTKSQIEVLRNKKWSSIAPIATDQVELAEGLSYEMLIKWGDPLSAKDTFGTNNDFCCFIPLEENNPNEGILWVNHESTNPIFVSDYSWGQPRTIDQVDKEMYSVGGSLIRVKREDGKWTPIVNDSLNRRITAKTDIPFNWDFPIAGSNSAMGTHSNCSGGITPWGTVLSCEENYDNFYGETVYDADGKRQHIKSIFGWEDFYNNPPEHYGWVVEIDPITGQAQKHVALGRFSHECCTLVELKDKRIVAYSGDDHNNEFIYKFVSSKPSSLKEGTLYVADTTNGKWISMDYQSQSVLQEHFENQTEVLIRCREAARLLGATPQNRPEDIEIDPLDGSVWITLTNNKEKGDYYGQIVKIIEANDQHDALSFSVETMLTGGVESGFCCPDNLAFDLSGNLWFTSDISGSKMNKEGGAYFPDFLNNGLYVVPRFGEMAGKVIQVASAPFDAEFTGPWFSPDYKTLFLSVQHPGDESTSKEELTSHWPHDADGIPKSSVICLEGPLLDKLNYASQIYKS